MEAIKGSLTESSLRSESRSTSRTSVHDQPGSMTNEVIPVTRSTKDFQPEVTTSRDRIEVQNNLKEIKLKDLGWSRNAEDIPKSFFDQLCNKEFWTLLRRFNKVA